MNGCIYCTADMHCERYSGDGVTSYCVEGPCADRKLSNADRIRAMSDEELAEWLSQNADCVCIANQLNKGINCGKNIQTCAKAWFDWLK